MNAFLVSAASGVLGLVFGFVIDEVRHYFKRLRRGDALEISSASFRRQGGRTAVIVVVSNRSDSAMTLGGGLEVVSPTDGPPYVLEGPAAGEIRDGKRKVDALDSVTLTFTATRDGRHGGFDLSGSTVRAFAGTKSAQRLLTEI